MAAKQNILGLIDAGRKVRRPPLVGMQFLHERPVRAADVLRARAGLNAKDLISFLFGHFAAARRARARPRCRIMLARVHASRAAGGQDTLQVDRGCRRRSRQAGRSAPADRAHRASALRACRQERGRASRRCRDRAPFRERPYAPARPCPGSSACGRQSLPATARPSRAIRAEGADGNGGTDLAAKQQKDGKQQRRAAADAAQQLRRLFRIGFRESVAGPQQQDENDDAEK